MRLQRDRLYEAMCTQRGWPFGDWNTFLNRHPIVRRHAQRLVWYVKDGDRLVATFRPLEDGTLTDCRDEPVAVANGAIVRVAHAAAIPRELHEEWNRHLNDYGVEPLFPQLQPNTYQLPEKSRDETELTDFEGHLLETFKLRSLAGKLGYARGGAEDGGWFYVYRKAFTGLGLEALIEFTGNTLPEENRTVALRTLSFSRTGPRASTWGVDSKVPLGRVPAVLISECWNDVRSLAALGPGFDKDWEKKSEYR